MAEELSGTNVVVQEEVKRGIESISKSDLLQIFTGKRPIHIPFGVYKSVRKAFESIDKERKKGTMHFVSNGFVVKDKDGKDTIKYLPKGITYRNQIKTEENVENI
jgi:hypothetical protein